MADLEKAAAQAEKENKDLFIVYRGRLESEAYGVPERQIFQICMAGRHLKKRNCLPDWKC